MRLVSVGAVIRVLALTAVFVGLPQAEALAQESPSRCVGCHFANPTAPARDHIESWNASPHRLNGVGCESCHGGDATSFDVVVAHRDVLASLNPASPVHRSNLPTTCGRCHTGPYVAFQQSRHFELLNQGERRGPTCTTCHGAVAARLLSPRGLEQQCAQGHGPNSAVPRVGRPEAARLLLEGIADVRASLNATRRLINEVSDPVRRSELDEAYQQAEVPLVLAAQAGHRFVFDELEQRLADARARVAALQQALVNPPR